MALLGIVVIAAWHLGLAGTLSLGAQFVDVRYVTALSFACCGVALWGSARGHARWTAALALGAVALSVITLAEYGLGVDLVLDHLGPPAVRSTNWSHPGRMAPNTTLAFLLAGSALALMTRRPRMPALRAAATLSGCVVVALGAGSLAGYALGISVGFAWSVMIPMAIVAAFGFVVLGIGIVSRAAALGEHGSRGSLEWLPMGAAVGSLTFTIVLWAAFMQEAVGSIPGRLISEAGLIGTGAAEGGETLLRLPLPLLMLVGGASMSAILGLAVRTALRARTREREGQERLHELAREVTRHEATSESLHRSSMLLAGLFDAAPDAIVVVDRAGRMVRVNDRAAALFGWSRPELLAMPLDALFVPRSGSDHAKELRALVTNAPPADHPPRSVVMANGEPAGSPTSVGAASLGAPSGHAAAPRASGTHQGHREVAAHRETSVRRELTAVHRDGSEFPIEVGVSRLEPGEDTLVIAVVRDVTERRRNEVTIRESMSALLQGSVALAAQGEILHASELRFRLLFERTADPLLLLDANTSMFIDCNRAAVDMLRCLDKRELLSRHPADLSPLRQPDGRLSREKAEEMIAIAQKKGSQRFDWVHCSAHRADFPVEVLLTKIQAGGLDVIVTTWRDLTERKKAAEVLERLAAVVENTTDLVGQADPQGRITYVNAAGLRMLGLDRIEDAMGRPIAGFHSPESAARIRDEGIPTALRDGSWTGETELMRSDGRLVPVSQLILATRASDGTQPTVSTVMRDLTERREAEAELRASEERFRQAQKMEAVGRLASGAAHDFNNLLTVIHGYGEILISRLQPGDEGRGGLERILKAADRATQLTRQLLAFGQKQVTEPRILDINVVVRDSIKLLGTLIGEDVEVVTELDPALGRVMADDGQIGQVIMNLAVNARDAMPDGGKLLVQTGGRELDAAYVRAHPGSRAGHHVRLAVTDNGTGMTTEVLSRIFEPFFTTKPADKGTGLGLAMVYGIVKQSGGHIAVESSPGRGTTFAIYLPRVEPDLLAVTAPAVGLATPPPDRARGEIILVVEDEDSVKELVATILENAGYSVLAGATPADALTVADAHAGAIDLLITDVVMAHMSGAGLARRLLARRPHVRILYISAHDDAGTAPHGQLASSADMLHKPFTGDTLLRRVRAALDARQAIA